MSLQKTQERLKSLSVAYLTDLLQVASGRSASQLTSWSYEPVHGGYGGAIGGTALYRFMLETGSSPPCSLILKILYERKEEDEDAPYYWKREYEVYRSGMLAEAPSDAFATPRIYDCHDYGDTCWIWMEDISDCKTDWTLADFHAIGARLGRFNGAWLGGGPLPEKRWLSRNWHAAIVPALADTFDELEDLMSQPLARLTLPIEAQNEIATIWRDRDLFRQALYRLPQTFCHIDAFRRNLLHRGEDVVLIDWAVAGRGALGVDLVALVAVSLYYDRYTPQFAQQLDEAVFSGYVNGLAEVGWRGEAALARLGYTCGMVLRGLAGVKQDINFLLDESEHDRLLRTHNSRSLDDIARFFAEIRHFRLLKMAREARGLLATLKSA